MTNKIAKKVLSFILVVVLITLGGYLMGFRLTEEATGSNVASQFIFDYYSGSIRGRVDGLAKLDKLSSLLDEDATKDAADKGLISKEGIIGNGFLEEIDTNQVMLSNVSEEDKEKTFNYHTTTSLKLGEDSIHTVRFKG